MQRSERLTLEDIARICGVSKGTVNRAIHNKPGINAATRERILQVIADRGFQPNYHARSLATGRTETIGVLLPNVENEFFAMLCSEIEEICWQRNYVMNLSFSNDRADREAAVIRSYLDRNVDGMIIFPVSKDHTAIDAMQRAGKAVVCVLNDVAVSNASLVVANERTSMAAITRHLVDLGHRRIAYINGYLHYSPTYNDYVNLERLAGYSATLRRNGIEPDPELIVEFDPALYHTDDYSVLERLLQVDPAPTAIQCFHDQMAIWILKGLKELGVRVPQDLSVTGFDDIRELKYIEPRLTTCALPSAELASEAVRSLFRLISEPADARERTVVSTQLVIGDSTGPCLDRRLRSSARV